MSEGSPSRIKRIRRRKKKSIKMSGLTGFIAGGVSGAFARTITSPLNVMKILFQLDQRHFNNLWSGFQRLYEKEGFYSLFKGNGISILRLFPYSGVKFFVFEGLKSKFETRQRKVATHMEVLFCGAVAGLCGVLVTHPLDLMKTRFVLQIYNDKTYLNARAAYARIYRTEGIRGLYKGAPIACLGIIPYEGVTFMTYEIVKNFLPKGDPRSHLLAGSIAVFFSQIFSYPFDLIKKRLQVQSSEKGMINPQYASSWDCFKQIVRKEGFLGLYKGNIANILKLIPFAAIQFATYESLKTLLTKYQMIDSSVRH